MGGLRVIVLRAIYMHLPNESSLYGSFMKRNSAHLISFHLISLLLLKHINYTPTPHPPTFHVCVILGRNVIPSQPSPSQPHHPA
jgi:hypothetical protein